MKLKGMIKNNKLLLFFMVVSMAAWAQKPALYPLRSNAALIEYHKNKAKQNHTANLANRTESVSTTTLSLPFYDEFSYAGPFPDSVRWNNSQSVFVNQTKAMAPPTLGVATLEGLNKFGYPYSSNSGSNTLNTLPSIASDTLSSAAIRLDSIPLLQRGLSPVDSVYLSFYYQGRGFWEKPDNGDYLFLDLYSPKDTTTAAWTTVWSHDGYLYNPDSTWHLVMIPITDTSYFHDGFKFRLRNFSGGSGDADHWHIDAVYLNWNRSYKDTMFSSTLSSGNLFFPDVSFVYDLLSPLKNYSQMPLKQYKGAGDMKTGTATCLRSDFSGTVSIETNYAFYNSVGSILYSNTPGSNNISPYNTVGYYNDTIIRPSLYSFAYPYPLAATDTLFTMKFFINSVDSIHTNDTIIFRQKFSNYYAYDDGSAEAGFGISPGSTGNYKTAVRYTLNVADTLRAMDIFFEPVIDVDAIKNAPFSLQVWSDNGGVPGNLIYTDSLRYAYFPADSAANGGLIKRYNSFLRYQFKYGVPLDTGKVFYIGINQVFDTPEITVGFDMNTDFHKNMFYAVPDMQGQPVWYVLPGDLDPDYRGALMMRPVFGDSIQTASINKYKNTSASISLYPNPASEYVFIQSENAISKIIITDLLGNVVLQQSAVSIQKINTSLLPDGAYFVKAFTDKGFNDTQKLIITR